MGSIGYLCYFNIKCKKLYKIKISSWQKRFILGWGPHVNSVAVYGFKISLKRYSCYSHTICSFYFVCLYLPLPCLVSLFVCVSPGGSDGCCWILGTGRFGEKCFGTTTNCKTCTSMCLIFVLMLIFYIGYIGFIHKLSSVSLSPWWTETVPNSYPKCSVVLSTLCAHLCTR